MGGHLPIQEESFLTKEKGGKEGGGVEEIHTVQRRSSSS